MTVKITKRDRFNQLLTIADVKANAELVEFINHELELLDNKANRKSTKPTKAQLENENIKVDILGYLETVERATVSEITKALGDFAPQKISALVKQLKDAGSVVRTEEKRVAYFSIA